MRLQPFRLGEMDCCRCQHRQARGVTADERAALEEVEDAEAGSEPRAARRRQDMVGPGDIVADSLGGMAAEKDGAGMANPLG